jgi:hypothetical protein
MLLLTSSSNSCTEAGFTDYSISSLHQLSEELYIVFPICKGSEERHTYIGLKLTLLGRAATKMQVSSITPN